MDEEGDTPDSSLQRAPGIERGGQSFHSYLIGLGFAIVLTLASFGVAGTNLVWAPGIPMLLAVLAIAQMGVHLVFFLHINSSPDHTNNILALAFGILIVALILIGSFWIMTNLNANMMPMSHTHDMQQ
jgi:cytochrome o ubiquinol oxidase subunit IV